MFQFPRLPSLGLCIQLRDAVGSPQRISPFGHLRVGRLFTANRSLSQCPTSFIGIWRQGIHRKPLVASPRDAEKLILFFLAYIKIYLNLQFFAINYYSAVKVLAPLTGDRCTSLVSRASSTRQPTIYFFRQSDPADRRAGKISRAI